MRNMILGTDWWTDCDDVAALRLLARKHQAGEIRLLGVILNACMEDSAASLSAFLTTEGLPEIPIGIDLAATDFGMREVMYQPRLAKLPHRYTNATAEEGVALYVRLLEAAETPVDILEIGYPQVLAALLREHRALVEQKVAKLWIMAGNWEQETGLENNFARNARSRRAGEYLCANWPGEITFLGWEVGNTVITGTTVTDENDPMRRAFLDIGYVNGRSSWDPMLCLLACIGDETAAGYRTVRGRAFVNGETGENRFVRDPAGPQAYVIKQMPDEWYAREIDALIQ